MTMNDDWLRAQRELSAHDELGCVACRGDDTLTGTGRGVKPLLAWLAAGQRLDGFSASDRVIGTRPPPCCTSNWARWPCTAM